VIWRWKIKCVESVVRGIQSNGYDIQAERAAGLLIRKSCDFYNRRDRKKRGRWYSSKAGKAENGPCLGTKNIDYKPSNVYI